jgi:hypothetical protein
MARRGLWHRTNRKKQRTNRTALGIEQLEVRVSWRQFLSHKNKSVRGNPHWIQRRRRICQWALGLTDCASKGEFFKRPQIVMAWRSNIQKNSKQTIQNI